MTYECLFEIAQPAHKSVRIKQNNDLTVLRVLVARWIERPPGVCKVVGSNLIMGSEFFSEYRNIYLSDFPF